MENYSVSDADNGLPINELPDAVKLIRLSGDVATELGDLALHKHDLERALECLESINSIPNDLTVVRQALWHTAIVYYYKSFGGGVRSRLNLEEVYDSQLGLENHKYFKNLRDKNVAHDVNSFSQYCILAALNDGAKNYKIEKIISFCTFVDSLEQVSYQNLHFLIFEALRYVSNRFDTLAANLTKELEKESYEQLSGRLDFSRASVKIGEISESRKKQQHKKRGKRRG
jgi:hypothetical protein